MRHFIKHIRQIITNKVETTKYLIAYYRDDLLLILIISIATSIAIMTNPM